MLLHLLALCVMLAAVETLHGIARTVWLAPRLGKARALKLSVVSGSLLAAGVCAWGVPPLVAAGMPPLVLGVLLACFMAGYDIVLGLTLLRRRWAQLRQDFNPATGNYLSLGLIVLAALPWLLTWLRGAG